MDPVPQAIRKYYKPKEKGEAAPDEEALVSTFDFPFPGAWPLEDTDGVYTKFGMPPLAIWLDWKPEFTPDEDSNFDNWLADMGGANGIPELVKTCLRSFLVQVRRICLAFPVSRLIFPPLYRISRRTRRRSGARGTTFCATSAPPTRPSCCASTTATRRTRSAR